MDTPHEMVFVNDEVKSKVLDIIRTAEKKITLASAYLDVWGHLSNELILARKKGVAITLLIRADQNRLPEEQIVALTQGKISVRLAVGLHAKIYMNEDSVLVTSMNLTKSSTENSHEIALEIAEQEDKRLIRQYVAKMLLPLSFPLEDFLAKLINSDSQPKKQSRSTLNGGVCIRCGTPISLDPEKPLCNSCYDKWAEWENAEYEEEYCHSCGKASATSYAKPLCLSCYRKQ